MNVKLNIVIILSFILVCQSCTVVKRMIKYGTEDIYDYQIFPYTEIHVGNKTFQFKQGHDETLKNYTVKAMGRYQSDTIDLTLDDFLKTTGTISFLIIRNDSILFERYYKGHGQSRISTVFSISKSVTSLLTGLAIDEGYISSVQDTVTKYIPELKKKADGFQKLKIEDLLNMRSGLKFKEDYSNLVSKLRWANFYYGKNQLKRISNMKFAHEPGEVREYQSATTALLGIVLERAIGKELGKYLEEKIWIPLGMEYNATWSFDDNKNRSSKSYTGLNTTSIDLAKIGRLYLNKGNWDGNQIIDSLWILKSITPDVINAGRQYQWYSMSASLRNNVVLPIC